MVQAWIELYQHKRVPLPIHDDCESCGFPHPENLLCSGAIFAYAPIGGHLYSININNIEYFVGLREKGNAGGFHWRNDTFFRRTEDGNVEITFYTPYNNTPQQNKWVIPAMEWKSIVDSVGK